MATLPSVIVTVRIDVQMAFVLSNRGKLKLSENGYVYVKNKKSADGVQVSSSPKTVYP